MREKWRKYRSRGWPVVVGKVTGCTVRKVDGGVNGADYWKIHFDYAYRVTQEHTGSYSFNCTSETMANSAQGTLTDHEVAMHYKASDEAKAQLWEDEVWNQWWEVYRAMV